MTSLSIVMQYVATMGLPVPLLCNSELLVMQVASPYDHICTKDYDNLVFMLGSVTDFS
jgi:hypothetical protein